MKNSLSFKKYIFSSIVIIVINNIISICWGSSSNDGVDDIIEGVEKVSIKKKQENSEIKLKPVHSYTLARFDENNLPLIQYTQQLNVKGEKFDLNRKGTREIMHKIMQISKDKTLLLAQGICMSATKYYPDPFIVTQSFLGVHNTSTLKMAWVSHESTAESDEVFYIRKPQGSYGGHAEPQLINDLEASFTISSDKVVKYFIPSESNKEDIYMCGLEIFGPYDMCDKYNYVGNNKYNCIGRLLEFRKKHQEGQTSISQAIRDKLKDRFKSDQEDAFIVVYHAKYPYSNVDTYKAEDEEYARSLTFNFNGCNFQSEYCNKNSLEVTFKLSQHESVNTEKDLLYGYIHHLADRTAVYSDESGFAF